ncbi:MAG: zinc metallopeptidase [Bacteroidales bacterium]
MIYIITIIIMVLSYGISAMLKSKFEKYSRVALPSGLSGKDIAEKLLRDNGIADVKVFSVQGQLTDHYNPKNKTVNLSSGVYEGRSVAAAAVAAHECGHAIQHDKGYAFLKMRSSLVPIISFSSKYVQWVLLAGVVLIQTFPALLGIGIIMFALTTLFSFITLPVEFNASRRALEWLNTTGIASGEYGAQARDALKWAAMTYVIAALGSLATLIYYISIFNRRRA